MKMYSIVLLSTLFFIQPAFSSTDTATTESVEDNTTELVYTTQEGDGFVIDFDAIDRDLEALDIKLPKPQKSWWITKQVKHYGTRIMIKALFGVLAVKEFCSEKWQALRKKFRALAALCISKRNKQQHEQKV